MKNYKLILLAVFYLASQPILTAAEPTSSEASAQASYFATLGSLCGQRFEGEMTFPTEGQDSFAGKLLVAEFASCDDTEVRVPFAVGEDRSRTWIFSKLKSGLQLKHDHRHEDGTPDDINMYGGMTAQEGTALSQSFAADEHTATIIPEASTNVWTVSLNEDATVLTYYLERHAAPRFKAVLKRVVD
ncbi:MAG: hypothetical protein AAF431_16810 [Pseudomonadota bacterium]